MKKLVLTLTIFLLINTSVMALCTQPFNQDKLTLDEQATNLNPLTTMMHFNKLPNYYEEKFKYSQINNFNNLLFSPEDIELKDDAFHGSKRLHFTEWWYFDCIFDNGYTAQVGIRVLSIIGKYLVLVRIDIYKDGILESHEIKPYFYWDFSTSKELPIVELKSKKIMEGYIDNNTGEWVYNLSVELDKSSVDLCFIGCIKGWKSKTPGGRWAVILPKAEVFGTITLDNEKINVSGIGYHDHNWEITVFTMINFGWLWGKVNSNNFTITWTKVIKTRLWGQLLLVLNEKNGNFTNIEPEFINLQIKDLRIENGMLVPYKFILDVHKEEIDIHITMEVFDTHHIRMVGIINHCRYHMNCTGSITVGSKTEVIDEVQIAEYIRLR